MKFSYQYLTRVGSNHLTGVSTKWDVLVSAYNSSDRVTNVFAELPATNRLWVVHDEYGFGDNEIPGGDRLTAKSAERESSIARRLFDQLDVRPTTRLCIDITGFMRPTLLCILYFALNSTLDKFWLLYSDPAGYTQNENTRFSIGIRDVRQVDGYQGSHTEIYERDVGVLGTGYDHAMMLAALKKIEKARRIDLFGLPSLQPSMYQDNILATTRLSTTADEQFFAPANDPFATADILDEALTASLRSGAISNLYLLPTGTKAQVCGFGLYYLGRCEGLPASIVCPIPLTYERQTSEGHTGSWLYAVEAKTIRDSAGHP